MEKRIKDKVEQNGIPLIQWGVHINRGILTGLNEAFIIDEKTKESLIKQDPKSAEIIRPFYCIDFKLQCKTSRNRMIY